MDRTKMKRTQWGITMMIGVLIIAGSVGSLDMGGDLAPNVLKSVIGAIISFWGLIKSYQWGFFEGE